MNDHRLAFSQACLFCLHKLLHSRAALMRQDEPAFAHFGHFRLRADMREINGTYAVELLAINACLSMYRQWCG